ncbi:MAG: hypothetical protein FJW95_09315 [Actinobacteria bacterium]|nr:hypothetical protein [Actinomycetota bacterium]
MTLSLLLGVAWGAACALPVLHRAVGSVARSRVAAMPRGPHWVRRSTTASGRTARRRQAPTIVVPAPVRRVLNDLRRRLGGRRRARAVERGVPLALDVLTLAARAGCTPRLALDAAARWSPEPVAGAFVRVEQRCALGAGLVEALDELGREEPALRAVTDALVVAERSGAPVAGLLARVADDARAALRRRAEAHARRVPVRLLFPLVFLVLPAFGLLTVVPALVAGLRHT